MADADVDDRGRRRGHAAAAHRGSEAPADARSQARAAGARREDRRGPPARRACRDGGGRLRLGLEPDQPRAPVAELWAQIQNDDWSLVSWQGFISGWPGRLWNFDKHYRYIGGQGAGAMGYGAPAAVGAALANRKHGRLSINIQTDGDLNYAPGVLWTACHHKIPLLTVMHNNRAYHQEVMFVQQMASQRNRGADRAHIGTTLREPNIDYAKMAQAYGMYGEGPIARPEGSRAGDQARARAREAAASRRCWTSSRSRGE